MYKRGNIGARGRNRTGTVLPPRDFKSLASTNFATRAGAARQGRIVPANDAKGKKLEAEAGIEPTSTALQAAA